jgi:hypothetical protein
MTERSGSQRKKKRNILDRKGVAAAAPIWGSPHIGHPHLHAEAGTNYHPGVGQS